ncbi:hypothetical protein [Chitiniphilus eburneus]|uniref:Uncharacterized protein n=1 Tax=Chitiniphilus eburneus TaxID=2571148 RepID=A0A4U0PPD8_9NEIS|nr:hypothetical protein [Chitiniphilus eburneus]TJZ69770.1 hypothetical protein FAZ21_14735 [Chitiniphilus eburneus]
MLKTYDMSSGSAEALEAPATTRKQAVSCPREAQPGRLRPELQLRLLTVAEAEASRREIQFHQPEVPHFI